MCGRYTLTSTSGLVEEFSLIQEPPAELKPRYNIAPTQNVAIVDNRPRQERVIDTVRWGLIPFWAKDKSIGNRLINARSETVAQKPAFRAAVKKRRCIIVADGFYEWHRSGKTKIPFYIRRTSHRPIAFAGLWERWKGPDDTLVRSCAIITTAANDFMAAIHNRMPVILAPDDYDRWLTAEPLDREVQEELFTPAPLDWLEMYEVSRLVNSARNEKPACIEPVPVQQSLID